LPDAPTHTPLPWRAGCSPQPYPTFEPAPNADSGQHRFATAGLYPLIDASPSDPTPTSRHLTRELLTPQLIPLLGPVIPEDSGQRTVVPPVFPDSSSSRPTPRHTRSVPCRTGCSPRRLSVPSNLHLVPIQANRDNRCWPFPFSSTPHPATRHTRPVYRRAGCPDAAFLYL
jgi:hypothetical protein